MSIYSYLDQFLQKLRKVRLPQFQAELERANFSNVRGFLPEACLPYVKKLLTDHPVTVEISKARQTKQGDFRSPPKGQLPKITINQNLNPYSFLITFVHEWAHLLVYENFRNRVQPHGKEWKSTYQVLLSPLLEIEDLDPDFRKALLSHIAKPKASTLGDATFAKFLTRYDSVQSILLEDIPTGSIFQLKKGLILVKGEKRRTRYLCNEYNGHKQYTVHALAEVLPVKVRD